MPIATTCSPGKLERAAFPQYWPFPASPCRRAVNQKDKEFVAGLFGSANRFRTQGLLVNSLTPLSISVPANLVRTYGDRKSTRLNSSHSASALPFGSAAPYYCPRQTSFERMPSGLTVRPPSAFLSRPTLPGPT